MGFHYFPKEHHLRQLWEIAVSRKDWSASLSTAAVECIELSDRIELGGRTVGAKTVFLITEKSIVNDIWELFLIRLLSILVNHC